MEQPSSEGNVVDHCLELALLAALEDQWRAKDFPDTRPSSNPGMGFPASIRRAASRLMAALSLP
jgi:hypothetical protein